MNRRGKPRKPTKVLEREGAFKINPQRRRQGEPDADVDEPVLPEGLDEIGQRAWIEICGYLRVMGILSKSDSVMLELYARSYSDYRKCQAMTDEKGIISNVNGKLRRNPFDSAKSEYFRQMMTILGRFGLSPSDRSNLDITKAADASQDPFVQLAKIGRGA